MLRFFGVDIPFFNNIDILDTQPLFGTRIISFNSWVHHSRYLQQYPHLVVVKVIRGGVDLHIVYHLPQVASIYIIIPIVSTTPEGPE